LPKSKGNNLFSGQIFSLLGNVVRLFRVYINISTMILVFSAIFVVEKKR